MTELDALLAEAEHLWKDSEFAAAIANYDRALEMVNVSASCILLEHVESCLSRMTGTVRR